MKSLLAFIFMLCCTSLVNAQNTVGSNGPNGSSSEAGRSYSNGNIPNPNEQTQNRPDSSLRSQDTTYMKQQWNDGSAEKQPRNKRSTTSVKKTATSTNKKKK